MSESFPLVRGRLMRITKTDSACGPAYDQGEASATTEGFVSVALRALITNQEPIVIADGNGQTCVNDEGLPSFNGYEVTISFCEVQSCLLSMLTGQPVVLDKDGGVVGFKMNTDISLGSSGFALELWMGVPGEACDSPTGASGYLLLPCISGGILGDFKVENAAVTFTVKNARTKNGNEWGNGPYADFRLLDALDPNDHLFVMYTTNPLPQPTNGCVTLENIGIPSGMSARVTGSIATITIPAGNNNCWDTPVRIDWGDGTITTTTAGDLTSQHDYASNGVYTIIVQDTAQECSPVEFNAEVSSYEPAPNVPNAPTNVAASAGNTTATVTWTDQFFGTPPVTYRVQQSVNSGPFVTVAAAVATGLRTHTSTGLTNGQTVQFRVRAENAAGNSAYVVAGTVVPGVVPGAPTNVVGTGGGSGVTVTWTAPPSGSSAISGYRIVRSTNGGAFVLIIGDTASTATTYVDSGTVAGSSYRYKVSAINATGTGPESLPSAPTVGSAPVVEITSAFDQTFGYGELAGVTGGTGGPVTLVTTTADSGAGSYRTALTTGGDGRIIRFDPAIAGSTITLLSTVETTLNNLTIDGTGRDITISGGNTRFRGTNIVVVGLNFFANNDGSWPNTDLDDTDAITFREPIATQRFIVAFCSFARGGDGLIDVIWNNGQDVYGTIVGCYFAEHDKVLLVNSGSGTPGVEGGGYHITLAQSHAKDFKQRFVFGRDMQLHHYNTFVEKYGDEAAGGTVARIGDPVNEPVGWQSWYLAENNIALPRALNDITYTGATVTSARNPWFSASGASQAMLATGSLLLSSASDTATEANGSNTAAVDTPPYTYPLVTATSAFSTWLASVVGHAGAKSPTLTSTQFKVPGASYLLLKNGSTVTVKTESTVTDVTLQFTGSGIADAAMVEGPAGTWTHTYTGVGADTSGVLTAQATGTGGTTTSNSYPAWLDAAVPPVEPPPSALAPVVEGSSQNSDSGTTGTFSMPAGIVAGELLLWFYTVDGDPVVTTPTGWVLEQDEPCIDGGTGVNIEARSLVFSRSATGTEAATYDVPLSVSEGASSVVIRVSGWTAFEIDPGATGDSFSPDAPAFTPAFGSADWLWIAAFGKDQGDETISASPVGYAGNLYEADGTTAKTGTALAFKSTLGTSENPSAWTISDSEEWRAFVVAVR